MHDLEFVRIVEPLRRPTRRSGLYCLWGTLLGLHSNMPIWSFWTVVSARNPKEETLEEQLGSPFLWQDLEQQLKKLEL